MVIYMALIYKNLLTRPRPIIPISPTYLLSDLKMASGYNAGSENTRNRRKNTKNLVSAHILWQAYIIPSVKSPNTHGHSLYSHL